MDFGSSHIYCPASESEDVTVEEIFGDELETGMRAATTVVIEDEEEDELVPPVSQLGGGGLSLTPMPSSIPAAPSAPPPKKEVFKKKLRFASEVSKKSHSTPSPVYRQRVDANVVALKLSNLASVVSIHSGDPVSCVSCHAVLSALSKVVFEDDKASWKCEFCDTLQELMIDPEEVPKDESVDFILAPPPVLDPSKGQEEPRIIFCVDISGSMCVTTEVQGRHVLKGNSLTRLNHELNAEGAQQFMPGQRRDVTHVSRLQCLQAAIEKQIDAIKQSTPGRAIGLVTFNNEVCVVGDGSKAPITIAGDKLYQKDVLLELGAAAGSSFRPIGVSHQNLKDKLFSLEEGGQTALGPALAVSVALASTRAGSQVVLCTDGLANIGLGLLDAESVDAMEQAEAFYKTLGEYAKGKGVVVSVISIEGQECSLQNIGNVADITGGSVERVNPLKLTENFSAMLEQAIIATNVSLTMQLHKGLSFKGEPAATNILNQDLGSINEDSEASFEFVVKEGCRETLAMTPSLPFQVRIQFTRPDGMKCLRVITQSRSVTRDHEVAQKSLNVPMLSANAARQSANMAQKGDYEGARLNAFAWRNVLGRRAASSTKTEEQEGFTRCFEQLSDLDQAIQTAHSRESTRPPISKDLPDMGLSRHRERNDTESLGLFKAKKVTSKMMSPMSTPSFPPPKPSSLPPTFVSKDGSRQSKPPVNDESNDEE